MLYRSRGVASTDQTDGLPRRGAARSPAGNPGRGTATLRRVLVAEDDPDISALVALALGQVGGLEVTICANGRAVLELVPQHLPDLFLLDVMMPEMDGLETLARLRLEPSMAAIPVIFMTARVRPRDLETYFAEGAAGVIAKPFDPMTLARHLCQLHAENRHAPD
jgi:two-component system, OmpR family, response regulator